MNPKMSEVLELISYDEAQRRYFFQQVDDPAWFTPLKSKGYFSADREQGPIHNDDKSVSLPDWDILPYLVRISDKLVGTGYEFIVEDILSLMREVARKTQVNPRTSWYFVKVLAKLPISKVPQDIFDLVAQWVRTDLSAGMVGMELAVSALPQMLTMCSTNDDSRKVETVLRAVLQIVTIPTKSEDTFSTGFRFYIDNHWVREAVEKNIPRIADVVSVDFCKYLVDQITKILAEKSASVALANGDESNRMILESKSEEASFQVRALVDGTSFNLCDIPSTCRYDDFVSLVSGAVHSFQHSDKVMREQAKEKAMDLFLVYFGKETYHSFYQWQPHLSREPLDLLTLILVRLLDEKGTKAFDDIEDFLNMLGEQAFLIFPKIALYLAGKFTSGSRVFWSLLKGRNGDLIFESLYFGDELKNALTRLNSVSADQVKRLESLIEGGPKTYHNPDSETLQMWKQMRYEALSHTPHFKQLYEGLRAKTGKDWKLSAAIGPVESGWGFGSSPLKTEDFLSMSGADIALYLKTFKTVNQWEGPTVWSLGETLRDSVSQFPEHFIRILPSFQLTAYYYVYRILEGLRSAAKDGKLTSPTPILSFVANYCGQSAFWKDELPVLREEVWSPDHLWVVGEFAKLVEDICRSNKPSLSDGDSKLIEELLSEALAKSNIVKASEMKDTDLKNPVQQAINSSVGQVLEAFIHLSLNNARRHSMNKPSKVEALHSKALFDGMNVLFGKDCIEAFTIFGMYLSNLFYLNDDLARTRVKWLDHVSEHKHWRAFMYGYLFTNRFYDVVYEAMSSHYDRALVAPMELDEIKEHLYEHIAVAFLRNKEDLSEQSRFGKWIRNSKSEDRRHVSWFFWSLQRDEPGESGSEKLPEIFRLRILEFWRFEVAWFKGRTTLNHEEQSVVGALAKLGTYLEELNDETFGWLMFSAEYVHLDHDQYQFVLLLQKLCNQSRSAQSAKFIGNLFLELLRHSTVDYPREEIIFIVEYLFSEPATTKIAEMICNQYGDRGNYFLKDVFNKHQRSAPVN